MDDVTKALIGLAVIVVTAVVSGGTMGAAMIGIAKKVVNAIVAQNGTLAGAIEKQTIAISELTNTIKTDMAVKAEHERSEWDLLVRVENAANKASENSKMLVEKLKGRL